MWNPLAKKEQRASGGDRNFTDVVVNNLVNAARGDTVDTDALAIVQAGVGLIQRTFEAADYAGDQTAINSIKPFLAWIVGRLVLNGEAFLYLDEQGVIIPCSLLQIKGEPGGLLSYRLSLIGADGNTREVTAAQSSVLSFISRPGRYPWRGVSPIIQAGLTGKAAAYLERFFELQSKQKPLTVIGFSKPFTPEQGTAIADTLTNAATAGQPAVFGHDGGSPSMVSSAHQGGTSLADLRTSLAGDLSALIGVPFNLLTPGTSGGNAVREALRLFHRLTLRPLATVIEREISHKTDMTISITFANAAITDHQGASKGA